MGKPTICVMMSTYNGERFLREQIDSILRQKGDFELSLLIRDDGSTDGTQSIIREYVRQYPNIQWYTSENLGWVLSFMNLVYHVGKYDYYAFSDQDDVWLEDKLAYAIKELEKESIPALYNCTKILVDTHLVQLNRKDVIQPLGLGNCFFRSNVVCGCTMVANASFHHIFSNIPFSWKDGSHDSLAYKVAELCGKNIFDPIPHMLYRQHGDNVVGAKTRGWKRFWEKVKRIPSYRIKDSHGATTYAKIIYGGVNHNKISQDKLQFLEKILVQPHTIKSNLWILRHGKLSHSPFYEYCWEVFRILAGWY